MVKTNSLETLIIGRESKEHSFSNTNIPTEIILSKNSDSSCLFTNFEGKKHLHFNLESGSNLKLSFLTKKKIEDLKITIKIHKNAKLDAYFADFSQKQNKTHVQIELVDEGASAYWHLASLSSNEDQKEFQIDLIHSAHDTFGKVDNYGVSKDSSKLLFAGESTIKKGSHNSKTYQNAKIMVFDEKAIAIAKPILKIDENDIEASHSAGVGKINDEHLFYLTSRGITTTEARQLITLGYLKPILAGFSNKKEQDEIMKLIQRTL